MYIHIYIHSGVGILHKTKVCSLCKIEHYAVMEDMIGKPVLKKMQNQHEKGHLNLLSIYLECLCFIELNLVCQLLFSIIIFSILQ